jgi:alkanesulfonate monooxygenase SsuD/methylene tetrahydromethanopterin reductase-like flavin-dependent oxidoreductase (luciferase family)
VLAEAHGYDGAWLGDGDASRPGFDPKLHLGAAWVAARTERMRLGVATGLPASFHPLRLAEETAMLDIMSGGRLDLALGPDESQSDDIGARVLREQLAIVERAWTGDSFSFEGEFFRVPELRCLPAPIQAHGPAVWISGRARETVESAGSHDHSLLTDPFVRPGELEERERIHRAAAAAAGHQAAARNALLVRYVHVAETTERARASAAPALAAIHPAGMETAIVGDPDSCREWVSELQARVDLSGLVCCHDFGGMPHEAALASQGLWMEKVAPALE